MADPNELIFPHFKRSELWCPHCHELIVVRAMQPHMEDIRELIGPFSPNSFYRCQHHNDEIGGAPNSFHVRGMACDIPVGNRKNNSHDAIVECAKHVGFNGIEICSTWVHVDIRPGDFWIKDMRT